MAMTSEQLDIEGGPETRRSRRRAAPPAVTIDPIDDQTAKLFLTSVNVIRDPLHGDVRVTKLERALIDTKAFQRLRHINQLAMVDTVFPGAVHTRFLHSLGTLHVCSELIRNCNNTAKMIRLLAPADHPLPVRIGPYAELLARVVALLHDTAHVPYGHVFEREAQVFGRDEWEDPWRLEKLLGPESEIVNTLRRFLRQHFAAQNTGEGETRAKADAATEGLADDIRAVLRAKRKQVLDLRYPFVFDLVSNTICADLLDYVQRDMFFCGLTEGLAKRFLQYIAVLPIEFVERDREKDSFVLRPARGTDAEVAGAHTTANGTTRCCRVVLLPYRYNERHASSAKESVLSEAVDLVRRRKQVAEKLYFHKSKLIGTSMLAAAAHASGLTSAEKIWDLSDHEVLKYLSSQQEERGLRGAEERTQIRRQMRATKLSQKLLDRCLFKPIYRLSYHPEIDDETSRRLWSSRDGVYARFNSPGGREELIDQIEAVVGAHIGNESSAIGSVSISCPNRDMQLKGFDMLVLSTPGTDEIRALQATVRPNLRSEIEVIQKGHEELWRLEVFVDPRVLDFSDPFARRLAGAIAHEIGMPNGLSDFEGAPMVTLARLKREADVNRELSLQGLEDAIKHVHYEQLVDGEFAARGPGSIAEKLQAWGYSLAPDPVHGS